MNYMENRDTSYRENIGRQIATMRNEARLSVRELAELSGVSFQNITKIENGKYNVSVDILGKICNALNAEIKILAK